MKVGVLGTGTMGAGIVQTFAQAGHEVLMRSRHQATLDKANAIIEKNLSKAVAKGRMTEDEKAAIQSRVTMTTDIEKFADREFITEIAAFTKRPDKVCGMHFFNPVPAMKLVEVIKGQQTSEETAAYITELSKALGKTPVDIAEGPGFVVNRILIPMINEGIGIYAEGLASAADIDTAMKLGANHPMGPLALGDLIGLDVCLAIMDVMYSETGDPKYRPHTLLKKMVRAGQLGMKSGKGFFDYTKK